MLPLGMDSHLVFKAKQTSKVPNKVLRTKQMKLNLDKLIMKMRTGKSGNIFLLQGNLRMRFHG